MKNISLVVLALVVFVSGVFASNLYTGFYYSTGPNSWSYVAQGEGLLLPGSDVKFSLPRLSYAGEKANSFTIIGPLDVYWTLNIQAPQDGLLQVGNYLATRFPFQDNALAGFEWSGNGRGLNTSTSWLNVLEVAYAPDNTISSLALDFVQFEETWGNLNPSLENNKWAYGSFRYNSTIPVTVPESTPLSLFGGGVSVLLWKLRKR